MENRIISDQFKYNMSGWLCEKTENCLEDLVQLKNEIDNEKDVNKIKELINNTLSGVYWDLTKILSFSVGGEWDPRDSDVVMIDGLYGIEKLEVKYGLKKETKIHRDVMKFVNNARELLKDPRAPNRTILYEYLEPLVNTNNIFKEIDNNLELVRDGQKEWSVFINETKPLLDELEQKYKDG